MSTGQTEGPIFTSIQSKLTNSFNPTHLDIINESYMHNVPKGSETHFKVVVVSEKFKNMKNLVQRHRSVNEILSEELSNGVHALSIVAKTPEQWQETSKVDPSPKCRHVIHVRAKSRNFILQFLFSIK